MGHEAPNIPWQSGYAQLSANSDADRVLYAPGLGLFGVFDGVGSTGAPAAEIAASHVHLRHEEIISAHSMAAVLAGANTAILQDPAARINQARGSETTATVARLVQTALGARAIWASVGDSRLYHVGQHGSAIKQITRDEGQHEYLSNGLGWESCEVKQFNVLTLSHGDGLILVTDGVTGDYDSDIMEDAELLHHYRAGRGDAMAAAETIVQGARKYDDRTAIVVQV